MVRCDLLLMNPSWLFPITSSPSSTQNRSYGFSWDRSHIEIPPITFQHQWHKHTDYTLTGMSLTLDSRIWHVRLWSQFQIWCTQAGVRPQLCYNFSAESECSGYLWATENCYCINWQDTSVTCYSYIKYFC